MMSAISANTISERLQALHYDVRSFRRLDRDDGWRSQLTLNGQLRYLFEHFETYFLAKPVIKDFAIIFDISPEMVESILQDADNESRPLEEHSSLTVDNQDINEESFQENPEDTNELEKLQFEVIEFLQSPTNYSFEHLYQKIYQIWQTEDKTELKPAISNIITTIFDQIFSTNQEEGDNINILAKRLKEYIHSIVVLQNIFNYYDSQIEKGEKVADIAVQIILTRYFQLETTVTTLQNDVSEVCKQFLRNTIEMPTSIKLVSSFVSSINTDLYKRIFDQTFTNEVNFYSTTLNLEELNVFDQITSLYDIYMRVINAIEIIFQPSTATLFKELFCKGVMKKGNMMEKILSEQTFLAIENPEILSHIYFLVQLSPGQWEKSFINNYTAAILYKLKAIVQSIKESSTENEGETNNNQSGLFMNIDQFTEFGEQTAQLISETRLVISNYLNNSEIVDHAASNIFARFLSDQNFSHQLCLYIEKTMQPRPFFNILCRFLRNDPNFEENYGIFMTRRLLNNPDPDAEMELLNTFRESGVDLHKLYLMLDDYSKSHCVHQEENGCDISLLILCKFSWPSLHIPEFNPPEFFVKGFNDLLQKSDFDSSQKVVRMCDRYSTVEFSNGEKTFSLPFVHACILQPILEKGSMSRIELASKLNMKESLFNETVNALIHSSILGEDENHSLHFVGPPTEESLMQDGDCAAEMNMPTNVQDDPALYANCNDQIDAAIWKFLKSKKVATADEIKRAVYETVPSRFPVTDSKIEACIQKWLDRECILHHGRNGSYRISSH